jgi:hypothetical protein
MLPLSLSSSMSTLAKRALRGQVLTATTQEKVKFLIKNAFVKDTGLITNLAQTSCHLLTQAVVARSGLFLQATSGELAVSCASAYSSVISMRHWSLQRIIRSIYSRSSSRTK